jgi:hypothetical protein
MTVEQGVFIRAGFWLRLASYLIDTLIIFVPISLVVGILFAWTDGRVFLTSPPIKYKQCESLKSYPSGLTPAPPDQSNFITRCSLYSVSGLVANTLTVGRQTVESGVTKTVSQAYPLNARNEPVVG